MYQSLGDLVKVGLTSMPAAIDRRSSSKYEFAVAAHYAAFNLHNIVMDVDRGNEAIAKFQGDPKSAPKTIAELSGGDMFAFIRQRVAILEKDLIELTRAFTPELKSLGVAPSEMIGQVKSDCQRIASFRFAKLGEATKQFSDVPEGHWAAEAVKSLRAVGILHGFAVDKFGG